MLRVNTRDFVTRGLQSCVRRGGIFGMPNARTHCPYCNSEAVKDLAYVLRIPGVDLFQCRTCLEIWHVAKDQNWPPGRDLLGPMKPKGD